MIDDYQPLAFGRAWGNDADYITITRKLGDMMSTNNPQEIIDEDSICYIIYLIII